MNLEAPALLGPALEAAVPLEVERLRGVPVDQLQAMVRPFPELIGTYGDQFLYGGSHAGEVFAAVATGIAALLLACPGGCDVLGIHFCDPDLDRAARDPEGLGGCVDKYQRCPRRPS